MGQSDKAVKEAALAQQLDPLSLIINTDLGNTLYRLRRYNEAIEQFRKTIELDPNFFRAHLGLGLAYEQQGQFAEATASLQQAIATSDRNPGAMAVLGHIHARAGRKREARKMLNELNELAKRRYVAAANQAIIYIGLGDNDAAFRWLQKSYNERASHMIYLSTEPIFDSLRADPRLAELIRRVGLVQ
jgi:Flp pilus assembly protein TadD